MTLKALRIVVALALTMSAAHAEEALRVGFRTDARPFSYKTAGGEYGGFIADICYAALDGGRFQIVPVEVTAKSRFEMLRQGGQAGGIDLLCDPTSIQPRTLGKFLLSPHVFATGVGYLRKARQAGAGKKVVVGYLDGTTSGIAVEIARSRKIFDVIGNADIDPVMVADHDEGIRRICNGDLEFYFGDLDILRALKKDYVENGQGTCDNVSDSQQSTFSYEAYALAVNPGRPDVAMALQEGLYKVFSKETAYRIYERNFKEGHRSSALQAVFTLNGVLPCRDAMRNLIKDNPCD